MSTTFLTLITFALTTNILMTYIVYPALSHDNNAIVIELAPPGVLDEMNETFTDECRSRLLYNDTWGQLVAPFVDKLSAKNLVKNMKTSVQIVPTLAIFDIYNVSKLASYLSTTVPNSSVVIKPTHTSGGIAKVVDGTYHCFKACRKKYPPQSLSDPKAASRIMKNCAHQLRAPYGFAERERQYKYIPRRIIIEQHLPASMKEYNWWAASGRLVFTCIRCHVKEDTDGEWRQSYYTTQFKRLMITRQGKLPCTIFKAPPPAWDRMIEVASGLAKHVPGVVRIDLYANDRDVYFSEFTFASNGCSHGFEPRLADKLVYAIEHELLPSHLTTPSSIERLINGKEHLR